MSRALKAGTADSSAEIKSSSVIPYFRLSSSRAASEPLFTIDDLLPHLGTEQSKKPLGQAIPGESLNILVGSRPLEEDDGKDRVKLAALELLNRKYGITEEDFISAELSSKVSMFRSAI